METYTFNNTKYYFGSDLMKKRPSAFVNCKNPRAFATKHKLSKSILYARLKGTKWVESDGLSNKFDKLFISQKWFDKNYPVDNNKSVIERAPPIIKLSDHEKFVDNNDNVVDIEVRGIREHDKCYFRVKDIVEGFGLKNLQTIITNKNKNGYIEGKHYVYIFIGIKTTKDRKKSSSNTNKSGKNASKKLYLTYFGMLRVLFASQKTTADKFLTWASKTLFTTQMGTTYQKTNLVSNLLGVSAMAVKQVFNKNVSTIPCIYLFSIGKVGSLRKKLKIGPEFDDKDFVYKWGMTIDLERRTNEHQKTYSKLSKQDIELVLYGFIDPQYISEAETKVAHLFDGFELKLDNEKYAELAIISSKKMKIIKETYDMISRAYMGHIKDLVNKIKDKDNEIILLKAQYKNELIEEKHKNQLIEEKYKNKLLQKEVEILNLKLERK